MAPVAPTLGGTRKYAFWPFNFRPHPSDFGASFQTLSEAIGTGGYPLTGTATNSVYIAVPASRKFKVVAASAQGWTGAAGGGAITAQLVRNNNQGTPSAVTLTAAQDITTTVFTGADNNVDFPITATDVNATLDPGDTLLWKIVAATTVTTVPVLKMGVEISVIR
jgi:hypothetical protein